MVHDSHDGRAGSLVMQAIGDAVGFLVEGYGAQVCAPYAEEVFLGDLAFGASPYVYAYRTFGQYSDDTQLARELVLSLQGSTSLYAPAFAERLAQLFTNGKMVGYGPSTKTAADKLIAGVSWTESGTPPPAAGDGAAMRAAPVGFLPLDDDELIEIADEQSRVTHLDMRSRAAAIVVALVVADAIRNGPPTCTTAWFERLAEAVDSRDSLLAGGVREMADWVTEDPVVVCGKIREWSKPPVESPYHFSKWAGISPFATPAVLYALYAYARAPKDPEEVLRISIAVGGDVDTVAAMAGAMVGAAVGLNGLTPRLANLASHLHDQGEYGLDDLIAIARSVK